MYVCNKPSEFSKQKLVPYIFCGSQGLYYFGYVNIFIDLIIFYSFRNDYLKAFLSRTILKIISKIGTYSYCTPLLICVGDCATVLVVWLPIILFECVAQFGRALDF